MLISIFFIIILFYSIILHEIAHGYAAYKNGDMTAYDAGRLTLNPVSHVDLFGSIVLPIISYFIFKFPFGWAKPVPYNPNNIKDKKYAELEIASAGILTNILLALLAVFIFYILKHFGILNNSISYILQMITSINLFLGLFNLLPFPPADGFSVFSELFSHISKLFLKIKNLFSNKKLVKTNYISINNFKNNVFKIKNRFSNPIFMIATILIAVNIFSLLVPFILSFINYIYSF